MLINKLQNLLFQLRLRSLAAQLCGLFVEVESAQFESRLSDTLPVIEQHLEPGKYKQVKYWPSSILHVFFFTLEMTHFLLDKEIEIS